MKISIWYKFTNLPYGGANNFLRRLGTEFEKKGHIVHYGYKPGDDVVLINSFVRGPGIHHSVGKVAQVWATGCFNFLGNLPGASNFFKLLRDNGPVIVHRVDGVTKLYGRATTKADILTKKINYFTHNTIFQSHFCRKSFQDFGMVPSHYAIINNGVPNEIFHPNYEKKPLGKTINLIAISWSNNPMKGFSALAKISLQPNVSLSFIGNWPDTISPEKVNLLGLRNEKEIADILRQHDAFVHTAINEPSSNAIIEALASGLPVLYRDSGGNAELVKDCGVEIDEDDLAKSVNCLRAKYDYLRETVLNQQERFSMKSVSEKYMNVFRDTLDFAR